MRPQTHLARDSTDREGRTRSAVAAAYVLLALADAELAGRRGTAARRLRHLTKPALMPTLSAAFHLAHPGDSVARRGLTSAHLLSWGGDVALLGTSERAFLAGLGSFFGAHVACVATFLARRGRPAQLDTRTARAAVGLWLTAAPMMSIAAGRTQRDLAVPVAAYATALAAMFGSAGLLDPQLPPRGRQTVLAGAALFLASDTLLGVQRFVLRREHPRLETAVMATYTAGQGLIAAGCATF